MSLLPHQEQDVGLISLNAEALPTSLEQQPRRRRGFFRSIAAWLGIIHDYTAEDIGRLFEAEISRREGESRKSHAEADATIALAAERHAAAEHKRSEAAKNFADAHHSLIETNKGKRREEVEVAHEMADAMERVAAAISRIKQQGGQVFFDQSQLLNLLKQGQAESPKDKVLQRNLFEGEDDSGA